MDTARDLRLVLLALGEGLIDPARLAAAAREWSAHPPFLDYLADRGWLTVDQRRDLMAMADGPTADLAPGSVDGTPSHDPDPVTGPTPVLRSLPGGRPAGRPPGSDRYRVADMYRAGGLGQVWRADDTALGRTVALKTLRPDRAGDPRLRARFVDEARITGQLEHPCVVPVYDLLPDGLGGAAGPCYTMRFVAGRTLAEAVRDYHDRRAAGAATRLDLAALLDAFVAVCRAVAYAHARNVLHRDLKGQNIVLGEYGEVFVLDWGLAKVLGGEDGPAAMTPSPAGPREETVTGSVLGTPAYMAPELAEGRPASPSTDIYALGAVLYVILTGRLPYDGTGVHEVLSLVQAAPPPPPRAVLGDTPSPLEAVCLKAMARDPAGRYPTADALAADVRRWLADEPVEAYPEPWPTRLARWGRRHRAAMLGAAAVLLTTVAALGVSTTLIWREERRTADQRDVAQQNLALAQGLSDNLLDLSEKHLAPVPQAEAARRTFLTEAHQTYRRALAGRPADPTLQEGTARLARYVANLHRLTGRPGAADECYAEAVRLYEALAAARPDDADRQNQLAETLRDQSQLFVTTGRLRDAAAAVRRAVELADRLPAGYRPSVALALIDLADAENARGDYPAATAAAARAVGLFQGIVRGEGDAAVPYPRLFLSIAATQLAAAERERGRTEAALAAHAVALGQFDATAADANERQARSSALVERARTLERQSGTRPQAEADYSAAIDAWTVLARDNAETPAYREALAGALVGRGRLRITRDPAGAAGDLDRAAELAKKLLHEDATSPDHLALMGRIHAARGRLAAGDAAAARAAYHEAVTSFRAARDRSPENAQIRRDLALAEAVATPPATRPP